MSDLGILGGSSDALDIESASDLDLLDVFGAKKAQRAGELSERTSAAQLAETQRQFDIGQERLQPFFEESVPAFQRQAALSGARGREAQGLAFQDFIESPGVEFAREQGLRGIETEAAVTGGLGGGDRLRELTKFSQGLALQDLSNQFNQLGVVSGAGQTAGTELSRAGERFAGTTSNLLESKLQGQTAALQGQQQATNQAVSTGIGALSAFVAASDREMKTDVKKLNNEECFNHVMATPLYVWKYLEEAGIDKDMHFGPMYQESPDCIKLKDKEIKALDVHDELWLIAGAIKHIVARVG